VSRAQPAPPPSYFGLALFATLCCFWPLGVAALIKSGEVGDACMHGSMSTANESVLVNLWCTRTVQSLLYQFYWVDKINKPLHGGVIYDQIKTLGKSSVTEWDPHAIRAMRVFSSSGRNLLKFRFCHIYPCQTTLRPSLVLYVHIEWLHPGLFNWFPVHA
jgi:hypothetical protein